MSYTLNIITAYYLLSVYVYVAFRKKQPGKKTLNLAKKKSQKYEIDFKQLVEWKADECP